MHFNVRLSFFFVCGQIPVQSLYEAKGTAGNIIPAIATTNAIIAGLQVIWWGVVCRSDAFAPLKCSFIRVRLGGLLAVLMTTLPGNVRNVGVFICIPKWSTSPAHIS